MGLYKRVEQIVVTLRPVFSREASFEWFVLLLWGVLLTTQPTGVTSYVNGIGLSEGYYHQALHWFHSSAFSIDGLCYHWGCWLKTHSQCHRLRGQIVYVGDGIKVGKEGRKMPGVKALHQDSENVSKPPWIRGHYFSALGMLLGTGHVLFATPIILKLHDGIPPIEEDTSATLVEKMASLCVRHMVKGSYGLLDAYYASVNVLHPFRENGLHLISRARSTTVARAAFCPRPGKHGPGRPRQWGSKIKLNTLFEPIERCLKTSVRLYGETVTVYYQEFRLHWDDPNELVLFVLTQLPNGKHIILLSSDINLTGTEVIEAYGWRFKIEVTFRTLVHLLGGFAYQFWLKLMAPTSRWPETLEMTHYHWAERIKIRQKVEAFERFVNLNALALGVLQVLSLELPETIWTHFPRWFRTVPNHGYPTEQIVRIALQHLQASVLSESRPALLLTKLVNKKTGASKVFDSPDLVT